MTPLDAQLLRPNDVDALRAALRSVNTEAGRHVLFGGCVADGTLTLTEFVATRTDQLRNLRVSAGSGADRSEPDFAQPRVRTRACDRRAHLWLSRLDRHCRSTRRVLLCHEATRPVERLSGFGVKTDNGLHQ